MDKISEKAINSTAWTINEGFVINLADVCWRDATNCWSSRTAKEIVDGVDGEQMKVAVIEAMLSEWRYKRYEGDCDYAILAFDK